MTSPLSQIINGIMAAELGEFGRHIVNNQCAKAGIDPENIGKDDLPKIAQLLSQVMATFGPDKAMRVKEEIDKLTGLESVVRAQGDPAKHMDALLNLGDACRYSSDFDGAMEQYHRLLDASGRAGDSYYTACAHYGIAMTHSDMSRPGPAMESLERALELAMISGDRALIAMVLHGIGRGHLRIGNYSEALTFLNKSLERTDKDPVIKSRIKMDTGLVHDALGDYPRALQEIEEAISLASYSAIAYDLARMYNNLGEVFKHAGDLSQAIKCYSKSTDKAQENKNERVMAYALGNSAECHAKLGMMRMAKELGQRAYDIAYRSKDDFVVASVHSTFGAIYLKDGDAARMNDSYSKAIDTFKRLGSPYDVGLANLDHGRALKELGDKPGAKAAYMRALASFRDIGSARLVKQVEGELRAL